MKRALITGITGQDAAYLSQLLLNKDYEIFGTYRRTAHLNFWRLEDLNIINHKNLHLVCDDLTDTGSNIRLIEKIEPNEIYNLAAQSFVGISFDQPITTAQINALGTLRMLEAIRIVNPKIKFYQASTSEMFGLVQETPQSEKTPFYPRSPYGISKLYAHWITVNYRESYNIFATSGILFNHESPLRGLEFVTRKITDALTKIKLGKLDCLELGNLDSKRDWGYAKEYVEGMYLMMQQEKPDTFLLATGKSHSIRDFVNLSAHELDISLEWRGKGIDEVAIDTTSKKTIIRINKVFYRPAEVNLLCGNAKKAFEKFGWKATTDLKSLCKLMVEADIKRNSF